MVEMIDLKPEEISKLVKVATVHREIEKMVIFGSRAMGNAKPGSDVDIALFGSKVTQQIVSAVRDYLEEETLLPYFFDVIYFEGIANISLKQHITEFGQVVYDSG